MKQDIFESIYNLPEQKKISDFLLGRISVYCEWIKLGGKPLAVMSVQDRYIKDAVKYVDKEDLNYRVDSLALGWKVLIIYKNSYILNMYDKTTNSDDEFIHWTNGKLFGYTEEAIKSYLDKRPNHL